MTQKLPVMELFYSLQGEGAYTGTPAYFIRLGGCDIGCHWCDVKQSWEAEDHPTMSVNQIVKQIPPEVNYVIITGGEPCMYDLTELTLRLKSKGKKVNLETSGAYQIIGTFDWICLSPKKRKLPLSCSLQKADELKVIIYNKDDFRFAESFESSVRKNCEKYLQVEWSKKDDLTDQIIDYLLKNPTWKLSLQTHKYINVR